MNEDRRESRNGEQVPEVRNPVWLAGEMAGICEHWGIKGTDKRILMAAAEVLSALSETATAWISVRDRMPKPNRWVLVYNGKWRGVGKYVVGSHLQPDEQWQSETTEFIELIGPKVTHWMPLPEAPK